MAAYEEFLKVYKTCITDIYDDADGQLKVKIDTVEDAIKAFKETDIRAFFDGFLENYPNIDFLTFERIGLNITKTANVETLKKQCAAFIDKVADELEMFKTQENQAEILVEYIPTLNASQAITSVAAKHKAIEMQRAQIEAQKQVYKPVPEVIPEPVVESKSVAESTLQKIAFVNYKSGHPEGGFDGQKYSYLIPDGFEYFAGQVLDVETRSGIQEAQIVGFGTIEDVPTRVIPFLKYLPEPPIDNFATPDFSPDDFDFPAFEPGPEEVNERATPAGNGTIRIAITDTVERIEALIEMLNQMGYSYREIKEG